MELSSVQMLAPLAAAGGYGLLSLIHFIRRGLQGEQIKWLQGYLIVAIVWQLTLLPSGLEIYFPNLSVKALLLGVLLLGMTTAHYLDWPRKQSWFIFGGAAILITLALDFLAPGLIMPQPPITILQVTAGGVAAALVWLILAGTLLFMTWRNYQARRQPWHANRLLFWAVALAVTFIGEGLLFFNYAGAIIAGQILRFIGVVGLTHGVSSYQIIDVREQVRRALVILLIASVSAGLITGLTYTVLWLTGSRITAQAIPVLFLVFMTAFLAYQPTRHTIERLLRKGLLGESFDSNIAVRNYSQAISRTLDVEQLSILIIGTISELLETNRGALILVTQVNGQLEVEPVPAMGRLPRQKTKFPKDSLLMTTLTNQPEPLLQYEIDFAPQFQRLSQLEREWLAQQNMEVYIPIRQGNELIGLIALGPKGSGQTYHLNELELMKVLADQTVVALQNARLYNELESQNEKVRRLNVDLRQQNTRLEIMDKVKSDFITIASHELRTPLTQVKGYTDILKEMNSAAGLSREQTGEIIYHINRASSRLEHVIAAMLDASELDVMGMQLAYVEANVEMIIRMAIEPLQKAMKERRISFNQEGIRELPAIIADFQRMVQAFRNLIANAIKFTPDGGAITVSGRLDGGNNDPEAEHIELVVADTGIGIDPKYHELIFEKFFRVGDPTRHSTGETKFRGAGPGLGLPIAKGVIEAHHGRIWVESEGEDELRLPGSRFHIVLPVCHPGAKEKMAQQKQPAAERPAWLIG